MRSVRNRSGANGRISSGVRPVAINSAIVTPKMGAPLNPHVPIPDAR